jgi:hypothetical protein
MLGRALLDPYSILVVIAVAVFIAIAIAWWVGGRRRGDELRGGLAVLRRIAGELHESHPIRRRLEAAPVVDLSFEEMARLMTGQTTEPAARVLVALDGRIGWIERFAQLSVHLGILGTVFALVTSDPTDLDSFRASLPVALGTTFWGLVGALVLSILAGACESVLDRARQGVREALLAGLDRPPPKQDEP